MRERLQGGSLAGFLIIGGLLALVLVGGLYGLNRYNAQKAAEEVAANESTDEPAPEWEAAPESESGSEEGRTTTDSNSESTQDGGAATDRTQTEDKTDQIPTTGVQPEELPQTGPADSILGLLAVGLLTFAGTHLVRSRL
jgi:cytoskeletal protein RodZ